METLVFSVCGGKWSVAWDGGQNGEGAGERGSETDGPTCRQTQEKPAQEQRVLRWGTRHVRVFV